MYKTLTKSLPRIRKSKRSNLKNHLNIIQVTRPKLECKQQQKNQKNNTPTKFQCIKFTIYTMNKTPQAKHDKLSENTN